MASLSLHSRSEVVLSRAAGDGSSSKLSSSTLTWSFPNWPEQAHDFRSPSQGSGTRKQRSGFAEAITFVSRSAAPGEGSLPTTDVTESALCFAVGDESVTALSADSPLSELALLLASFKSSILLEIMRQRKQT